MSPLGQERRFDYRSATSGVPPTPDISLHALTVAMGHEPTEVAPVL